MRIKYLLGLAFFTASFLSVCSCKQRADNTSSLNKEAEDVAVKEEQTSSLKQQVHVEIPRVHCGIELGTPWETAKEVLKNRGSGEGSGDVTTFEEHRILRAEYLHFGELAKSVGTNFLGILCYDGNVVDIRVRIDPEYSESAVASIRQKYPLQMQPVEFYNGWHWDQDYNEVLLKTEQCECYSNGTTLVCLLSLKRGFDVVYRDVQLWESAKSYWNLMTVAAKERHQAKSKSYSSTF